MSSWAQTLTVIVTLGGLFMAGFGFLWHELARRLERLEDRIAGIDRRLAHMEGERGVPTPEGTP